MTQRPGVYTKWLKAAMLDRKRSRSLNVYTQDALAIPALEWRALGTTEVRFMSMGLTLKILLFSSLSFI